jgi:spermidine/putrescine transport system ATP-binding protein
MIEVRGVTKRFPGVLAVDDVTLSVEAGDFLTLVGPSGCGKTTLLRLLSGFEQPDLGSIALAGRDVTRLPPFRRDLNQVFQSYALFPHLTVRDNIAFGLRMQKVAGAEMRARVDEAVALVALEGLEDRRPHQLSGGQRQRVALARAIAPRPAVLLLDEPLSALDAKLRQQMQGELKRLQRKLGMTFVSVTHDRAEALAMSDHVAVMNRGRVVQSGPPSEIYLRPATAFVADFIAEANVFRAERAGGADGRLRVRIDAGFELDLPADSWPEGLATALVSIRPERITVSRDPALPGGVAAKVAAALFQGASERLVLETASGTRVVALVQGRTFARAREGEPVWCSADAADAWIVG